MKKNKLRPLGQITDDLEPLICELIDQHKLQMHEVLALIHGYIQCHFPEAIEIYEDDGSNPVFRYGPK